MDTITAPLIRDLSKTVAFSARRSSPEGDVPKPIPGYIIAVDVSGHLGYGNVKTNQFTNTSGFSFGDFQTHYGDVGGRAKLFAVVPSNGLVWQPYVAATVDQRFGFSSTGSIPAQAALPTGDSFSLQQAKTFGGAEIGVDLTGGRGWTLGAKAFYEASADTNIAGGRVSLKIPLLYGPTVTARY